METALAQSPIDPADLALLHFLMVLFYLPFMNKVAGVVCWTVGCLPALWVMLAYFVFAVYYTVEVGVGFGLMQVFGSFAGALFVLDYSDPSPIWMLRDLELMLGKEDAKPLAGSQGLIA